MSGRAVHRSPRRHGGTTRVPERSHHQTPLFQQVEAIVGSRDATAPYVAVRNFTELRIDCVSRVTSLEVGPGAMHGALSAARGGLRLLGQLDRLRTREMIVRAKRELQKGVEVALR